MAGRPAVQPPRAEMAKLTLDEYAATQRPTRGATEQWFDTQPEVLKAVLAGFERHNLMVVYRWLKAVHNFPLSTEALRGFKERQRPR